MFGNSKVSTSSGPAADRQSRQDKLLVADKELKGKGDEAKPRPDVEKQAAAQSSIWASPRSLVALGSCPCLVCPDCPRGVLCLCRSPMPPLGSSCLLSSLAQASGGQVLPLILP